MALIMMCSWFMVLVLSGYRLLLMWIAAVRALLFLLMKVKCCVRSRRL